MRKVTITDLRNNLSHFLELSATGDIQITKKGEVVAILTSPDKAYYQNLNNLYGCLKEYDNGENYKDVIGEEIMRRCGY